jgi:glutathione S-transferase
MSSSHSPPPISSLTLYHYPLSRSLRVLWLIHELGISNQVEVKTVKLMLGEGYSEEYLKLNPFHAVPVLTFIENASQQKQVMLESSAIVRFLATLYRDKVDLIPIVDNTSGKISIRDISQFEFFFTFISVTMDSTLWQLRLINDFRGRMKEEEGMLEFHASKWNYEILPVLDKHFSQPNQEYVSNLGFTVLDILMGQTLNWAVKYSHLKILHPPTPSIKAYVKRISSRPAWKVSTKDGHLFENDAKM